MRRRWDQVAYLARYGMQPIGDIMSLTLPDASAFQEALERLVDLENKK